ncbi:hypothetical protein TI01_0626 [Lysobacter sp. A03]|nr:hypothetical protein TI01_0626 [Lysobacter sp. A03]
MKSNGLSSLGQKVRDRADLVRARFCQPGELQCVNAVMPVPWLPTRTHAFPAGLIRVKAPAII